MYRLYYYIPICMSIIFSSVSVVLGEPIINSTPPLDDALCPDQPVSLTCETRGSPTIQWISLQYIDAGGSALDFIAANDGIGAIARSPVNSNSTATLINNTMENGTQILASQLNITTSAEFPTANISCSGSGMTTIAIQILGNG